MIDSAKCVGHGRCYELAPAVFGEDDRGHCTVLVEAVPPEHEKAALHFRQGGDVCGYAVWRAEDRGALRDGRRPDPRGSQRRFDVVGRLTTSSVYAGGSQPLLYRIESTDGGSPRTLAYIKPTDALKVGEMLGRVVGIIRGSTHKQSEVVNVIEPSAVELISGGS